MVAKSKPTAQAEIPYSDWQLAWLLAGLLLLVRAGYVAFVSPYALGPDEAQYWHWSTQLDWSFATKPPLTTWLIWLSTHVLGQTEFAVKFFALFGQATTLLLGFALARELAPRHQRAAGWWAFALLAVAPATGFAGLVMAPDVLLVPLYLAALLVLTRETAHTSPSPRSWLYIGVLVGLAGLAKYSAVFFFPLAGLFALIWRRDWLLNRWFYVAGLIALALQTPVIYWNLAHQFTGFAHVAWQVDAGDTRHGGLGTLLNLIGGQLGIFGPIVFGLMFFAVTAGVLHHKRIPVAHRLALTFIVPLFAGFLAQTLWGKVQPNWPILATIPALIFMAAWLPAQSRFVRGTALAGLGLNALLSLLLSHALLFGFPHLLKPLREMLGVREVANMTSVILSKLAPDTLLLAANYPTTARQAFYAQGPGGQKMAGRTLYLNPGGERATQYDLWAWPKIKKGQLILFVAEGSQRALPAAVAARVGPCEYITSAQIDYKNKPLRAASYYMCGGK